MDEPPLAVVPPLAVEPPPPVIPPLAVGPPTVQDVPDAERAARFQCLMVYMEHDKDPTPIMCQGTWEGRITHAPQGENGFGYDPVFYVPEYDCTAAELSSDTKNALSHRGQALQKLLTALKGE